jgi:hypothetical protein
MPEHYHKIWTSFWGAGHLYQSALKFLLSHSIFYKRLPIGLLPLYLEYKKGFVAMIAGQTVSSTPFCH